MDIDEMTGKPLGIAVAKEVMGWTEYGVGNDYPLFHTSQKGAIFVLHSPELSWRQWMGWRSLDDTLEVVEELHAAGSRLVLRGPHWGLDSDGQWNAEFVPQHGNNYSFGDDAPVAILRAALKAVRHNAGAPS